MERAHDGDDFYLKLMEQELDEVTGERFYKYMSNSISYERKRIGGDWVVAQAVPTRKLRDGIRKSLGNDKVLFFLLGLEREVTLERLTKRHGDGEAGKSMTDFCIKVESFYELKAQDEDDTFDIIINKDMGPNDVAQKVMEIVNTL